jgi:hypothetical protein
MRPRDVGLLVMFRPAMGAPWCVCARCVCVTWCVCAVNESLCPQLSRHGDSIVACNRHGDSITMCERV